MQYLHSVHSSQRQQASQQNSSHIAKGINVDRTRKVSLLFDPVFVVAIAAVTELVLGFSVNLSELFATLIAGRPEVLEVCIEVVVIFIVVLALFDGLVTKEKEMPFNMEGVVERDVLRIETAVGFVFTILEAIGFDIVPATFGALDMAGKVIVNVLVALIVIVWSIVMSDVTVLAMAGEVCAWAVIVSVRVTVAVNVVLTFSVLSLVVVIDVLRGCIDIRTVICSDTGAPSSDFVVSQSLPSDAVRTSGYQPYSCLLAARLRRLLSSAQTSVVRYASAKN